MPRSAPVLLSAAAQGRAYYDKKLAEGKTPTEALRSLKRQVSNAIFACLQADARRAAVRAKGPGGQQRNDYVASAAGSHPRHRLFGQATPGPGHHPTATPGGPPPGAARGRGRAGHSSIAAIPPPAMPKVQVERPQRSEDERPGGAARRRPQLGREEGQRSRTADQATAPEGHLTPRRKGRRSSLTQRSVRSGRRTDSQAWQSNRAGIRRYGTVRNVSPAPYERGRDWARVLSRSAREAVSVRPDALS